MATEQIRPTESEEIDILQVALRGAITNNIHFKIAFQTKIQKYIETGKTQIIGREEPIDIIIGDQMWRYEHCAKGESKTNTFEKEVLSKGIVNNGYINWEKLLTILYPPPYPVVHFEEGNRKEKLTYSGQNAIQKGYELINELNKEK